MDIKALYLNELCKRLNVSSYEEIIPGQDINKIVNHTYKEKEIEFYNSYNCIRKTIPSSEFFDIVDNNNLIAVENGTFFKTVTEQEEIPPSVETEIWYGKDRDTKKSLMKFYSDVSKGNDPIKARYYNSAQTDCKLKMNTFYGLLQIASPFYNPDLASSITCRGRSTISVCALTVESILGGYWSNDINAILYSIDVVKAEVNSGVYDSILDNLNGDYPIAKFISSLPIGVQKYRGVLYDKLRGEQRTINMLGIKNNINNFIRLKEVSNIITDIITKCISINKPFTNPYNKGEIASELNRLCEISKALMGFYWYQGVEDLDNVQQIIKDGMRTSVVLIDTDSNMISLTAINKIIYECYGHLFEGSSFTARDIKFTISNISTVILDYLIDYSLERYKGYVNIPMMYRDRIAMKNEYYYSQFSLTENKKNYAALMDIKEGVAYPKSKLDVKGLMFIKSVVNENIADIVSDIVETDVLRSEKINLSTILSKLRNSATKIGEMLKSDDSSDFYATQKLNKPLLAFNSSESRLKSVELYNVMGISEKMIPPLRFYSVKVDYEKDSFREKYFSTYVKIKVYEMIFLIHKNIAKFTNNLEELINDTYSRYEAEFVPALEAEMKAVRDTNKSSLFIGVDEVAPTVNASKAVERVIKDMMNHMFNLFAVKIKDIKHIDAFKNGYNNDTSNALSRDEIYFYLIKHFENDGFLLDALIELHTQLSGILKSVKDETKVKYNTNDITKKIVKFITGVIKFDTKVQSITRIALPESIVENLPDIVLDLIDITTYTTQIDNLLSPVVNNLKLVIIRNDEGTQLITNVLNYY